MNREMRRLQEREERRQKKQQKADGGKGTARGRSAASQFTKSAPAAGEKKSLWQRLVTFLHEVRVELRKVSWPTREQMIAFTTVTLITTVALTLLVFGADVALKETVLTLLGGASG